MKTVGTPTNMSNPKTYYVQKFSEGFTVDSPQDAMTRLPKGAAITGLLNCSNILEDMPNHSHH